MNHLQATAFVGIDASIIMQLESNDPKLQQLVLIHCSLTDRDIIKLARALQKNTHLKELNVSGNQITAKGAQALAQCPYLEILYIEANQLKDEGAIALSSSKSLKKLSVEFNQIGCKGAQALAGNKSIIELNLSRNRIKTEGAKYLARNTSLRQLSLNQNCMDDSCAKDFASNTTLRVLQLQTNYITNQGAQTLARNIGLLMLRVSDNSIDDEGAKALAKHPTLRQLFIAQNQLTDEGAKAFLDNSYLTKLIINRNQLSQNMAQQLEEHLKQNRECIQQSRNEFIKVALILAIHKTKTNSTLLGQIPLELLIEIFSYLNFPSYSLAYWHSGKECVTYVLEHVTDYQQRLSLPVNEGLLRLKEKVADNTTSVFSFFKSYNTMPNDFYQLSDEQPLIKKQKLVY